MKKVLFMLVSSLVTGFSTNVCAQEVPDSLKQVRLQEIVVSSTRVGNNSPIAFSNLNEEEIKKDNTARNIPYILESLPSVVAFSEDGSGVGNTSMRIRGTDATRINVTLNGMPLNNPESQEVFWVNLPDLSNSLKSIQLQRGVGTSTNGSAAFGASLSLQTLGSKSDAYGSASTAIGSYNTFLSTIAFGTGVLKNGLSFDARYSRVLGDGYIRNGSVNHKNLYTALSYYTDKQLFKLVYMNGIQHTGITWEGISPEQMKIDRRFNLSGIYYDEAGNMRFYDNETDNYYSNIVQFLYSLQLDNNITLNANLSYNNGFGYYENYKTAQKFIDKFGLPNQVIDGVTYKKSDIIRQKLMANDFYVANVSANYQLNDLLVTAGISYNNFAGDHYGRLKWIKFNDNIPENYEWYRNNSSKKEFSSFMKGEYRIADFASVFGDVQYRYVDYRMEGIDDDLEDITNKRHFNFFNPKAGAFFNLDKKNIVYVSFAVANREPHRNDIKASVKRGATQGIRPERLYNYEFGYKFVTEKANFNANFYYMKYKDQLVQTGRLNDVGYKYMENVDDSYRAGIELIGAYQFTKWLRADANLTLSRNKIKNHTAYFDVIDQNWEVVDQISKYFESTDISFSPNVVGSGMISIMPVEDFSFSLIGKYVGKQYYDNTSNPDNRLSDYFVANMVVAYAFKTQKIGKIDVQLTVNNILNKEYVANASVDNSFHQDGTPETTQRLFPQAPINVMGKVGISF